MFVITPAKKIKVANVYRDSGGNIILCIKQNKAYEELTLTQFLDLVYQAARESA